MHGICSTYRARKEVSPTKSMKRIQNTKNEIRCRYENFEI